MGKRRALFKPSLGEIKSLILRLPGCYPPRFALHNWSSILSALALAFVLSSCGGATTHEVCARLLAFEGRVEINGQQIDLDQAVNSHRVLCAGTTVRTSAASTVQLACLPNALVHLSENSIFEINSLSLSKDGNETDEEVQERGVRCRLAAGAMDFIHRGTEGVAEFIISTPQGNLDAKFNCLATVAVNDRKTRITCATGMVTFVPSDGSAAITVEAGFVAEWPSQRPVAVAAAKDASDQQTVMRAFDMGGRLESLLKARGPLIPWRSK
jgi:hypothetical protein